MSELRTRMIQAMTARGFSPRTQEAYVRAVVGLARHYRRAPDQLSADDVQAYIALLFRERKRSWSTCSQVWRLLRVCAHPWHRLLLATTSPRASGSARSLPSRSPTSTPTA